MGRGGGLPPDPKGLPCPTFISLCQAALPDRAEDHERNLWGLLRGTPGRSEECRLLYNKCHLQEVTRIANLKEAHQLRGDGSPQAITRSQTIA